MRIVMLCRLYWPHIGGVERHVKEVSKEAIKEGHHVDIFTLKHEDTLPSFQIDEGIHIHRKPTQLHSRVLIRILNQFPFVPKKVAQGLVERDEMWGWLLWNIPAFIRADIIHIHDVFFWYWPIRILLFWKKVFITFHGFEAGSLPSSKARNARQLAARYTQGNIAIGAWIKKWYGTQPTIVSYGAGNCTNTPENNLIDKEKVRAVFIGRLETDTGFDQYLKFVEADKTVQLDIYGEGSQKDRIPTTNKRINYRGTTLNSCVVFPTYALAFVSSYLSIIEAMQCKTFVIAFASDALKNDYLYSHPMAENMLIGSTAEELEAALTTLTVKKRKDMIDAAHQWAKKQTWNKVYTDYKKLWRIDP